MRWYKQDSGLFDRLWTADSKAVSLYVYLHCAAYVNDRKLNGQIIRRGSCLVKYEDVAERIGLTVDEIRLRLKLLAECGEVITKRTNRGMIITVCDYDGYHESEDLFAFNDPIQPQSKPNLNPIQPQSSPNHNNNIEYKNVDIKNIKRESKALIYEIKDLYNRRFAGKLPEWKRLSEKMAIRVDNCVARFGRQSVDMVFDQIEHEPFSLGENKSGFIADAFFIFSIDQYEKYLARYQLRISKKSKPAEATCTVVKVGVMPEKPPEPSKEEKRRMLLMQWVEDYRKNPTARNQEILTAAYESGELERLGIDWKPN
jgi:hypothetical protein